MPTVSHVIDHNLGIDYGFLYELRDEGDVLAYWEEVAQYRWSYGFGDFLRTADMSHATTPEGNIIRVLVDAQGKAPLWILGTFTDRAYLAMARTIRECGPIVVNRNGGFFPLRGQAVKESREVPTWTLPGAKIKVSQWPGGTHFYARVGDEDVVENGRNKWFDAGSAERAAKRFAKEKGIHVESD